MCVYRVSCSTSPLTRQVHVRKSLSEVSLEMLCQAALGSGEHVHGGGKKGGGGVTCAVVTQVG